MLKRYLINNELDATKDGPNVTRMEAAFGTLAAVTLLAALAACSPAGVVVGAGANAGTAAVQERTMADAADDAWIKGQITTSGPNTTSPCSASSTPPWSRARSS